MILTVSPCWWAGGAATGSHRPATNRMAVAATSQGRTRRVSSTKVVGLARLTMGGLSYARAKGAAMRRIHGSWATASATIRSAAPRLTYLEMLKRRRRLAGQGL